MRKKNKNFFLNICGKIHAFRVTAGNAVIVKLLAERDY